MYCFTCEEIQKETNKNLPKNQQLINPSDYIFDLSDIVKHKSHRFESLVMFKDKLNTQVNDFNHKLQSHMRGYVGKMTHMLILNFNKKTSLVQKGYLDNLSKLLKGDDIQNPELTAKNAALIIKKIQNFRDINSKMQRLVNGINKEINEFDILNNVDDFDEQDGEFQPILNMDQQDLDFDYSDQSGLQQNSQLPDSSKISPAQNSSNQLSDSSQKFNQTTNFPQQNRQQQLTNDLKCESETLQPPPTQKDLQLKRQYSFGSSSQSRENNNLQMQQQQFQTSSYKQTENKDQFYRQTSYEVNDYKYQRRTQDAQKVQENQDQKYNSNGSSFTKQNEVQSISDRVLQGGDKFSGDRDQITVPVSFPGKRRNPDSNFSLDLNQEQEQSAFDSGNEDLLTRIQNNKRQKMDQQQQPNDYNILKLRKTQSNSSSVCNISIGGGSGSQMCQDQLSFKWQYAEQLQSEQITSTTEIQGSPNLIAYTTTSGWFYVKNTKTRKIIREFDLAIGKSIVKRTIVTSKNSSKVFFMTENMLFAYHYSVSDSGEQFFLRNKEQINLNSFSSSYVDMVYFYQGESESIYLLAKNEIYFIDPYSRNNPQKIHIQRDNTEFTCMVGRNSRSLHAVLLYIGDNTGKLIQFHCGDRKIIKETQLFKSKKPHKLQAIQKLLIILNDNEIIFYIAAIKSYHKKIALYVEQNRDEPVRYFKSKDKIIEIGINRNFKNGWQQTPQQLILVTEKNIEIMDYLSLLLGQEVGLYKSYYLKYKIGYPGVTHIQSLHGFDKNLVVVGTKDFMVFSIILGQ
eukprot:403363353